MSRRVLASQRCRAEITDKGEGVHASCAQIGDVRGRCGCLARNGRNRPRPGADPYRRAAAHDRAGDQERHRELYRDADRPRHDQRARRGQRAQGRLPARRHSHPDCRHQRDRAPDHQGRGQDHARLRGVAARGPGQPGRRAPWRIPLGNRGRGRHHHQARLQVYVPGRAGGLPLRPGGGRPHARRARQAARQISRRPAHRVAVGEPRVREVGRRLASAPTPRKRASIWSTTKATTSSSPT